MIDIGRDFAPYPAGTVPEDGPYNAQAFRGRYLIPALRAGGVVQIRMDSARGYASSWLAAAFGGLSCAGFTADELLARIEIISEDMSLVHEVREYIAGMVL